jgi:membrane-associated phospholipid phosphatase
MNSDAITFDPKRSAVDKVNAGQPAASVTFGCVAKVIAKGYAASMAVLIGLGLLLTRALKTSGIVRWDKSVIRYFADHRTPSQTNLSAFWSRTADAPSIIVIALLVGIVLAIGRNWREVIWLAVIIPAELAFFLTVSYAVGRTRPDVVHLGSVPSTGSFPSGHVAITIVLYGTMALIAATHVHAPVLSRLVAVVSWAWTIVAAAAVGWARMYRGMHHPLDIAAGVVLGFAVLLVGYRAFHGPAQPSTSTPPPRSINS